MRLLTLEHRQTGLRIVLDAEPRRHGVDAAVILRDPDGQQTTIAQGWTSLEHVVTVLEQTRHDYPAPEWEEREERP